MIDEDDLPAGEFGTWLDEVQAAIRGERASEVPCDGCTACCTSSQFVHVAPDETDTLAHIPAELLFPAPGLPRGHVLLGYDERGHCPMLVDNRCSIYAHRPRTCRSYDCRVFPAAGVDAADDGETKALVAQRAVRWRFEFATAAERAKQEAVRAAARSLIRLRRSSPELVPGSATQLAVVAVELHEVFLGRDEAGDLKVVEPDPDVVRAELRRRREPLSETHAQWTHTGEPRGMRPLAQIQSMAASVTRTQPWEAG